MISEKRSVWKIRKNGDRVIAETPAHVTVKLGQCQQSAHNTTNILIWKKKKTRQKYIIIVGYIIFSLFTYSLLTLSLSLHLLTIQFLSVVSFSFLFVLFCFIFASLTLLTFLTLSLSLVLSFFLFNFERERERGGEFLSWVGLSRSAQLKCDGKQWILQPFFLLQSLLQPHT